MNSIPTYRLETIEQAISVGTTLTESWFRGHGTAIGALAPRAFRPEFSACEQGQSPLENEMRVIEQFRANAGSVALNPLPSNDDHLGWLGLMQHHGAPTRLLDWSENVLAPLFFAVSADESRDGEVWGLLPWALNMAAGAGWGTPLVGRSRFIEFAAREPFWRGTSEELASHLGLQSEPKCPLAILPWRHFRRLHAQAGAFTLHITQGAGRLTIEEALPDERHLVRYVVPATSKARLRADLRALGVHDFSLFPDLDGLARQIRGDLQIVAYSPPQPPACAGRI